MINKTKKKKEGKHAKKKTHSLYTIDIIQKEMLLTSKRKPNYLSI